MANTIYNNIQFKTKKDFLKFKELLIREDEYSTFQNVHGEVKLGVVDFNLLIPILYNSKGLEKLDTLILPLYNTELTKYKEVEDFKSSILEKYIGIDGVLEELVKLGYMTSIEQDSFILLHAESFYTYKENKAYSNNSLWGTTNNASNTNLWHEDRNYCSFNTLGSCPLPIFEKLAELGLNFNCGYYSEDIEDIANCGLFTTKEGKLKFIINKDICNKKELFAFSMVIDIGSIDCYTEDLYEEYEENKEKIEYLESCEIYEEKMEKLVNKYKIQS